MDKNSSLEIWIETIEKLDDQILDKRMSDFALEDAKMYSLEKQVDKIEILCLNCKKSLLNL